MQFTPQQLAGAGRYQHKTRIGNWNEDAALEEVRCGIDLQRYWSLRSSVCPL
jgi:hypothetical protein